MSRNWVDAAGNSLITEQTLEAVASAKRLIGMGRLSGTQDLQCASKNAALVLGCSEQKLWLAWQVSIQQ